MNKRTDWFNAFWILYESAQYSLDGGAPTLQALPPPPPQRCERADAFQQWINTLFARYDLNDVVHLYQAVGELFFEHLDRRSGAPKRHRDNLGSRTHICIHQVYIDAGEKLRDIRRGLVPPPLIEPAPQPTGPSIEGFYESMDYGDD